MSFYMPVHVEFKSKTQALCDLLDIAGDAALFISCGAVARYGLECFVRQCQSNGAVWISDIPANPTEKEIARAMDLIAGKPVITAIALGGGSTIDLAKAVVALLHLKDATEQDVLEAIQRQDFVNRGINLVAVPTTAGTGSEVTRWATVWSDVAGKHSIEADWLYPRQALIVPELTISMPENLTIATGLDALCHAVESYWAKAADSMTRELSKTAIRLIVEALPKAKKQPNDAVARKSMCLGSLCAGLAFSNTKTTACHSISYPLTQKHNIPHGIAVAVTLARVMDFNKEAIIQYELLLGAFGMENAEQVGTWMNKLCDLRLQALGVPHAALPDIAKNAFTAGRMDNNPLPMSGKDVEKILEDCYAFTDSDD